MRLSHHLRDQAVQPDARQRDRQQAKESREPREQQLLRVQPIDLLLLRAKVEHRQRRIDLANGRSDSREYRTHVVRGTARARDERPDPHRERGVPVQALTAPEDRSWPGPAPRRSVYFASAATPTMTT